MLLPDHTIREYVEQKLLGISPFNPDHLNPASYDMTLCAQYRRPVGVKPAHAPMQYQEIDMKRVRVGHTEPSVIPPTGGLIKPGAFILCCTEEVIRLPDDLTARVEGKSSVGRVGLAIHVTAGFIDPGFEGQVTLEVANLSPWPIRIYPGMRIAQMAVQTMTGPAERPYGATGRYQGQTGPTESRYRIEEPTDG